MVKQIGTFRQVRLKVFLIYLIVEKGFVHRTQTCVTSYTPHKQLFASGIIFTREKQRTSSRLHISFFVDLILLPFCPATCPRMRSKTVVTRLLNPLQLFRLPALVSIRLERSNLRREYEMYLRECADFRAASHDLAGIRK